METKEDEELFEFIKDHSVNFLEMAFRTDYHERIDHPDAYGQSSNQCGDRVEVFLTVRKDKITSVSLGVSGCINTNACSNTVASVAEGKTVGQAWRISPEKVSDYLETLPRWEFQCAELAISALRRALANFLEFKQAPWKKLYA